MTTYFVGIGGNDGNAGTSWALRKLTLNGAEDIPVVAGDTVYVGPGTYRELLTCDVSGESGLPITYIGDYTGANTDGVGGVVRITGSDDDKTSVRARCITSTNKNYRTFIGFTLDYASAAAIENTNGTNWVLENIYSTSNATRNFRFSGDATNAIVQNCYFLSGSYSNGINFEDTSYHDNQNITVQNCIIQGSGNTDGYGIVSNKYGGVTIKNCTIYGCSKGIYVVNENAGQTVAVNNCIITNCLYGLQSFALGFLVEDYNNVFLCNTARTNVDVGANSLAYYPLYDSRWFHELVNGGNMLSPFDLASYSELVGVAGTSPTTTDMRGTSAIGGVREWGALEYDSTLEIEAGSGGTVIRNVPIPIFLKRRP